MKGKPKGRDPTREDLENIRAAALELAQEQAELERAFEIERAAEALYEATAGRPAPGKRKKR